MEENERIDKYLDFARELKKLEPESNYDTNCNRYPWNGIKNQIKRPEKMKIRSRVDGEYW